MDEFELSQAERMSAVWQRLERHCHERLDTLRRQNDHNLTEAETAKVRGRIAEIKRFLALGDTPAPPEADG